VGAFARLADAVYGMTVNWQAVAAIGTLAAVVVALWPIYCQWWRDRAAAAHLRYRILTALGLLRPVAGRRFGNFPPWPRTSDGLSPNEKDLVWSIEQLFSQAHLLTSKEQDKLGIVLVNLAAVARLPSIPPDFARSLLDAIDDGVRFFEKQRFLRRRSIDVPWTEEEPGAGP
jgi:hypothetical protein